MARRQWAAMALALTGAAVLVGLKSSRADEPAEPPPPPPPVIRVYPIHDLVEPDRDLHIYDDSRAQGFALGLHTETYPPMGTPSPSPAEEHVVMRHELVEDLIKLLEATVASDSWRDNGGSEGSVRESQGMLIVTQSLTNQKLVKEFLDRMSDQLSKMVRVEADWLWLAPAEVSKLLQKGEPAGQEALQEVDANRLANLPPDVRHLHAEVTGRNGQTMFIVCGREKSLVTNVTPVVSTATSAFAPTVSPVAGGTALQVKTMAKPESGFAVLLLAGGYDELGRPRHASAGAVAGMGVDVTAATQPTATSQPAAAALPVPTTFPSTQPVAATVQSPFQTIGMKVQELRTTLRVPLGRSVLAARSTWDPTGHDHSRELLLIVTVHASK